MSSEEQDYRDLDSIPLGDYLKETIPVEDIRDYASLKRIHSIDFVKGFAIVMIMIAHTGGSWLNSQWIFFYGVCYTVLDIVGPSLFVFLSALSVVFSIKKKKKGAQSEKVIRNRILSRGLTIIVIGVLFNIFSFEFTIGGYPFPLNLWGWNILMFIGFSQIFSLYALKLGKLSRAMIGLIIIFTSDGIREFLFIGKEAGNPIITFFHYIVVSPSPMTPLLPWLAICFIATIFGELLHEAMISGTKKSFTHLFRVFMLWGLIFVIGGLWLGRELYVPGDIWDIAQFNHIGTLPLEEYPLMSLLNDINSQMFIPEIRYPGMCEFLIRGRGPNMIYNMGAALLLIGISFYFIDIKEKTNYFISMLKYYGRVSLSLFLMHFVFVTLFFNSLDLVQFIVLTFSYIGFYGFFMFLWMEFYNGVGSPEWIMIQVGRIGQKTGQSVKKEIHIIEEDIKDSIQKRKEKHE
ncbi:MAG: OpgC domain-containing protein [Candidatus Lokiarchaeota archaeon]|nr:OpgC domain-containing protein [Candidatus Lokiarchaeota archaeon]